MLMVGFFILGLFLAAVLLYAVGSTQNGLNECHKILDECHQIVDDLNKPKGEDHD